jgi:glyoxylase-like metal-dependent hydrolase (beta-lactamase superfamily II)
MPMPARIVCSSTSTMTSSLFCLLALAALGGCASQPPIEIAAPTPIAGESAYRYGVESLGANVHVLTQGNTFHLQPRGNVGIIEQTDGVVLFDSGGSPAAADEVIDFVRSQTSKPVTAIILSHWHGDHVLGVSRLLEVWPKARVISTRSTRDLLASPQTDHFMPGDDTDANARYMANNQSSVDYLEGAAKDASLSAVDRADFAVAAKEYAQFAREMSAAHRVVPNEVFDTRLELADATTPVEIRYFGRANTAGDAIAWLPRQRIVFSGDVVVAPIPYGFNTYPGDWIDVLDKLSAFDFAVLVPGHGEPQRDGHYLGQLRAMLVSISAQAATLASDSAVTNDNVGTRLKIDPERKAITNDDPWLQRWFRNYWLGPIGSSALRAARGEDVIQGAG